MNASLQSAPAKVTTAFVAATPVHHDKCAVFTRQHIDRSRPLPPRIPLRRAPQATAVVPRTIRVHEDANNIEQLAQTLASAFEDDPVINYMQGPHVNNAHEKGLIFNRAVLRAELLRPKGQSTIHVADDGACVAVWHYVGHWKMKGMYMLRFLIGTFRAFGPRFMTMASAMQPLDEFHPTQPHMHLFIIGTHKDQQGKGYGSRVISEMLSYCDEQQLPAYLESSNEKNLPFYKKHGFRVLQEIPGLPAEFPSIYALWRDPQPIQEHPE